LLTYPVAGDPRQALLCVFDGHGPGGELVSEYLMLQLPDLLEQDKKALQDDTQTSRSLTNSLLIADRMLKESQTPSAKNGTTAAACVHGANCNFGD